jgi:hypothetical protein
VDRIDCQSSDLEGPEGDNRIYDHVALCRPQEQDKTNLNVQDSRDKVAIPKRLLHVTVILWLQKGSPCCNKSQRNTRRLPKYRILHSPVCHLPRYVYHLTSFNRFTETVNFPKPTVWSLFVGPLQFQWIWKVYIKTTLKFSHWTNRYAIFATKYSWDCYFKAALHNVQVFVVPRYVSNHRTPWTLWEMALKEWRKQIETLYFSIWISR